MAIPGRFRRAGAGALFLAGALVAFALAVAITLIGVITAGGAHAYMAWLQSATPYFLVWRLVLYGVGGGLYIGYWRPRLRRLQQRQADGGEAGHCRLVRSERLLIAVIALIELTNLSDLVSWAEGQEKP